MKTEYNTQVEEIKWAVKTTSTGPVLRAEFAGCQLELNPEKTELTITDDDGDSEFHKRQAAGDWLFVSGDRGQKPTMHWPDSYYEFVLTSLPAQPVMEEETEYKISDDNYVLIQGTEGNYESLVWECEADSVGDDGSNAIYRIPLCEISGDLRARADIDNTL